ncbi:hypothetical protein FJZ55_04460, partial [Candidatus Woesearchaeota archaeon]|nr:hypothetical protein [Candidatus Woesearchaeota archaeon]
MSLVFWLLAGELVLLAVGISAGLFFINKRREHRLYESVTQLLQAILDSEPGHLEQMRDGLLALYPLSGKNKVDKLTQQIVEGEREFFRELIRILLLEDTRALPGLHKNLQGLMARQREILQQLGTSVGSLNPVGAIPQSRDNGGTVLTANDPVDDADLDDLLQAVASGDPDEEEPVFSASPVVTDEADSGDDDDDDDLDTLLQAAALGDFDEDTPLVAGGDDEEEMSIPTPAVVPMPTGTEDTLSTSPEEAAPAEGDDLDALLQAAALGDLDEDTLLVAGGDAPDPAPAVTDETWSARSLLDDSATADDDNFDALLQAAALGDFDEDALLIDGNDEEEGTQEPEVPAPGQPAVPDEFDAILADMSRLDTA